MTAPKNPRAGSRSGAAGQHHSLFTLHVEKSPSSNYTSFVRANCCQFTVCSQNSNGKSSPVDLPMDEQVAKSRSSRPVRRVTGACLNCRLASFQTTQLLQPGLALLMAACFVFGCRECICYNPKNMYTESPASAAQIQGSSGVTVGRPIIPYSARCLIVMRAESISDKLVATGTLLQELKGRGQPCVIDICTHALL